jgi:glycosyltransferase involved in cell wall biosynthesis
VRVLLTTDTAGGVWSHTEELADALRARGHQVALVAFGAAPSAVHREWLNVRPELPFTWISSPLEWMAEPEPALSASVDALRGVVEREEPDLIHLNQFFYGAHQLGAPKLVVAHSDVLSWWRVMKGENAPDDPWFRRYTGWVLQGLAGADLRVAPSAWMAGQAEAIYGFGDVQVVHNGRSATGAGTPCRARDPWVVAAGRLWDEAKGVGDLAGAAPDIPGRVIVAGAAEHPAGGADFPRDAPGVEYAGMLPAAGLRELLGRAAVYAATSRYEPFGLAPLEAALAGCALVMTDIPTFRELWEGCALFYPPGDVAALAAGCRELLQNPDRRQALSGAAGKRARERYNPGRMAAGYEALYRRILA